jgi:hypothetical protein
MTMTKTPKLLPWIARKAKISDERAEALWYEAVDFANRQKNLVQSTDYYPTVFSRLHELIEQDKATASTCPPFTALAYFVNSRF